MWRNFHELRSTTIEALWKGFLTKLSITDIDDHLVFQLLVDSVFEEIVHEEFEVSAEPVKSIKSVLTQDEQIVMLVNMSLNVSLLSTRKLILKKQPVMWNVYHTWQ